MRIPRGLHRQAYRPGNLLTWRPGWQGTGMRPIARLPVGLYRQPLTGLPLTGGQGQAVIGGWAQASGSATAPTAFQTLVTITPNEGGLYTIQWTVTLAGTPGAGDANNFRLVQTNPLLFLAESVNAGAAGTYPQAAVTAAIPAGAQLIISAGPGNGTAGAVYTGTIGGQGGASVTVGPQGLGNIWYPAQLSASTTSGQAGNDNSTANVYLGSQGVPVTLLGTLNPGTGVLGLAVPSMSPGQYLITVWTGGNPGDVAAVNVVGTMDALTTM